MGQQMLRPLRDQFVLSDSLFPRSILKKGNLISWQSHESQNTIPFDLQAFFKPLEACGKSSGVISLKPVRARL